LAIALSVAAAAVVVWLVFPRTAAHLVADRL
jgi:hypothetical protein